MNDVGKRLHQLANTWLADAREHEQHAARGCIAADSRKLAGKQARVRRDCAESLLRVLREHGV